MWESRAAFWRDFSMRGWESAWFADFHGRVISIKPNHARLTRHLTDAAVSFTHKFR